MGYSVSDNKARLRGTDMAGQGRAVMAGQDSDSIEWHFTDSRTLVCYLQSELGSAPNRLFIVSKQNWHEES